MPADDALTPEARREVDAIDAALAGEPVAPELTELGRLAVALREERPGIRPAFARDLDTRAAAGFPRRRRLAALRARLAATPSLTLSTAMAGILVVGVAAALLTDAGNQALNDSGGGSSGGRSAEPPTGADGAPSEAARPEAEGAAGLSPRTDGRSGRLVERSASVVLAAAPREVDAVAGRIVAIADRLGGFVASSSVTATDGRSTDGGGELLLRVPTARLAEALARLSRVAHVRERRETADDITREGASARNRLTRARAERRSLLRRLAAAATDAESARLGARLRSVERRIAAAETELSRAGSRARYATVAVSLVTERRAGATGDDDGGASGPAAAPHDALRVLEPATSVLLVALAVALPLGLLAAAGGAVCRAAAGRGRRRALDAV